MKETVASYIQMTYLLFPPILMTFSHPRQMVPERSLRWRFYDRRVKLSIILCLCILISERKTTNQLYRAYQKNPLYKSLYHQILYPQLPRVSPFFTPIPYVSSNRRETRKKTNLQLCTRKKSAQLFFFLFSSPQLSLPTRISTTPSQLPGLIQYLLRIAIIRATGRVFRVSLAALGDGHHGGFGPDVDGGGPIYAFDTTGFNRHDVFSLLFGEFGLC